MPYPSNLGYSFAGTVQAVGPNITNIQVGDRLAILRGSQSVSPSFGSFQKFALAEVVYSSKLLPNTSSEDGAATILNLATVVSVLSIHLGLDRPSLTGSVKPSDKKVLIYGGSSSSGGLAIRYASTAGYKVVTTSSPQNREFVQSLGADYIIDHTATPDVISDEIRRQGPYDYICDTIGLPPVTDIIAPYLASLGGGVYNSLVPPLPFEKPLPDTVQRRFASYGHDFEAKENHEIGRWFFEEYLPKGLESGLVVPTRHHVIEGGLPNIQDALDLMNQGGVSGRKLIMYP